MMIFLFFLLAHLVADFLLQTEQMVEWKRESWYGILLHGIVHFLVSLVLLAVYLPSMGIITALVLVAAAHVLIDWLKIVFEKRAKRYLVPFLLDQAAHIAVLGFAAWMVGGTTLMVRWEPLVWVYTDYAVVVGLCLLILVTYGYEIAVFQLHRKKSEVCSPNYSAMAQRVVLWAVLYGLFLLFGVYKIVAFG